MKTFISLTSQEKPPQCHIPLSQLHDVMSIPAQHLDTKVPPWLPIGSLVVSVDLTFPIAISEIRHQFSRLPNDSRPGLPWKKLPASDTLLSMIFNICLLNGKIPASWKRSTTILIYTGMSVTQPTGDRFYCK